jgi:hypothetical protein
MVLAHLAVPYGGRQVLGLKTPSTYIQSLAVEFTLVRGRMWPVYSLALAYQVTSAVWTGVGQAACRLDCYN